MNIKYKTKQKIIKANYADATQAKEIGFLLNEYAKGSMGGGEALSLDIQKNVVSYLSKIAHSFTFIAYVDEKPSGLITAFENFSTFKCKPLINIHDIMVLKKYRGMGISQRLLDEVEKEANSRGCCKITLEVLEGNAIAQNAYKKFGFKGYELDPKMGKALFWEKSL